MLKIWLQGRVLNYMGTDAKLKMQKMQCLKEYEIIWKGIIPSPPQSLEKYRKKVFPISKWKYLILYHDEIDIKQ